MNEAQRTEAAAAEEERQMRVYAEAFSRQAKSVKYDDYKVKEDFRVWLNGYREKIRNEYGFKADQDAEVNAEVLHSISGKLTRGTALNAYNRLTATVKDDYMQLVDALTKEFTDPHEKMRFQECFGYNVRKKGQSIKDFAGEIKLSQDKYSDMKDNITIGNESAPNTAKIRDGIRRFKKGIRDRNGQVSVEQRRHLRYNLQHDDDLTWENAIDVASRWEAANDFDDSDDVYSEDEDVAGAAKPAKSSMDNEEPLIDVLEEEVESITLGALAMKVEANSKDIKEIRIEQKRFAESVNSQLNETKSIMKDMLAALNAMANSQK